MGSVLKTRGGGLLPGQVFVDPEVGPCLCLANDGERVLGISLSDGRYPLFRSVESVQPAHQHAPAYSQWAHAALANYDKIGPLLPDHYFLYPFVGGLIYLNARESRMMLARILGVYEAAKTKRIFEGLKPGVSFADIGSNKGDFALLAAARVGPNGNVLAFEPEPDNVRWLTKSIAANGYQNIVVHACALGATDGDTTLYLGEKSGWHTLLTGQPGRSRGTVQVAVRRLDSVLDAWDGGSIDMAKIDVEGAELLVLEGGRNVLAAKRIGELFLDVHPQLGVSPLAVKELLESYGYRVRPITVDGSADSFVGPGTTELIASLRAA